MPRKSHPVNRGWPTIAIVNGSTNIAPARLKLAIEALQIQLDRDFLSVWGWRAKLKLTKTPSERLMRITLLDDNPDDDGVEGYHFSKEGVPRAEVYTHDDDGTPYEDQEVFATLSHEILEMVADPDVNLYASDYRVFQGRRHRAFFAVEVCDAVQECTYKIKGIRVSDFVVPEWFESEHPPGSMRFSFKDNVKAPLTVARGGYLDAVIQNKVRIIGKPKKKVRHRMLARQLLLNGEDRKVRRRSTT